MTKQIIKAKSRHVVHKPLGTSDRRPVLSSRPFILSPDSPRALYLRPTHMCVNTCVDSRMWSSAGWPGDQLSPQLGFGRFLRQAKNWKNWKSWAHHKAYHRGWFEVGWGEIVAYLEEYSWIGRPVWTHNKSICRETERATTDLNIRMKSSRQGTSTGAG